MHSSIFTNLLGIFWLIFILYWLVSAIGVKKNIRTKEWRKNAAIRIMLIVVMIILLQINSFWKFGYQFSYAVQIIGVILCAIGLSFAIWARRDLGRNWSGTPSMKEDHELITSGPYHFVRHPIYTGILLALFGSVLAGGILYLMIFIICCINFLYRIPVEEKYMQQLFPNEYPEYKKKTKTLILFIW